MRVSLESIRNAICSVFLDIILMVNGNDTVHVTSKFQKITLCKSKAINGKNSGKLVGEGGGEEGESSRL